MERPDCNGITWRHEPYLSIDGSYPFLLCHEIDTTDELYYEVLVRHSHKIESYMSSITWRVGCYVWTEADRGYDIGCVIMCEKINIIRTEKKKEIIRNCTHVEQNYFINDIPMINMECLKYVLSVCTPRDDVCFVASAVQADKRKITIYYTSINLVEIHSLARILSVYYRKKFYRQMVRIWLHRINNFQFNEFLKTGIILSKNNRIVDGE